MAQYYTYDQLKNATEQQLRADPGLLNAWSMGQGLTLLNDVVRNYGSQGISSYWSSNMAPGNHGFGELARNVDRYANWNNPTKPEDQKRAFEERTRALSELQKLQQEYSNVGFDITSVPQIQQFYQTLGETPGSGTTSIQAAQQNVTGTGIMDKLDQSRNITTPITNPASLTSGSILLQFYLAEDGRTVLDNMGNVVSLEDYKRITGQQNVPDTQLDWSYVQKTLPPSQDGNSSSTGGSAQGGNNTTGGILSESGFSTGMPELDALYGELSTYLEKLIESGKTINPNIELTPAEVQAFMDQASSEVSPYYQSQISTIKNELSTNLQYLKQQYDLKKQADEQQFQQTLGNKREDLAGAGLAFSGSRAQQEQGMQSAENLNLESQALSAGKAAADAARAAEKAVGSRNLEGLNMPAFTSSTASLEGKGGYNPGRTLDFYSPSANNVTGSLEYSQRGDIRSLADFLKTQEINKRTLAFGG